MSKKKILVIVVLINLIIFGIANVLFTLKYEQVDDFIIYNMYSGLDGTFNIHGIYIHPIICFILGMFFKLIPFINWHTFFLLAMQFLCFTLIGYTLLKKFKNGFSIIFYIIFASIYYTSVLLLIQYTSVAALLILTALFLLIDKIETSKIHTKKYNILIFILFTVGIMLRMQALLVILPFIGIYLLILFIQFLKNRKIKDKLKRLIKNYFIFLIITAIVYISNVIIYNSDELYKNYMEYNEIRSNLHDINYVSYEENKEIFDEIQWSKNDHYLFYTFGFGDENKYSKENLKKILDYKIQKDGKYQFNSDISEIIQEYSYEMFYMNIFITILFFSTFGISIFLSKGKRWQNVLIFITTIGLHIFFIALGRSMLRVVIPEYILGTVLLFYNMKLKLNKKINDNTTYCVLIFIVITSFVYFNGTRYKFNYKIEDYKSTQDIIQYTNQHKENVYLYTVPSLQFRYLAYNIYQMPPKASFSNLRVIGGWDMFTQNYYDFKERYNLDGTLLDLLKENVYLIDGKVTWSGNLYDNYKQNIIYSIKENYNINVKYKIIKKFDNLCIYKLQEEK